MKVKPEIRTESNIPIYCQKCHIKNSFIRDDKHSIKSENGKLLWIGYVCQKCGSSTIRPAGASRP